MKKLFYLGCSIACIIMTSCSTESIDDQNTIEINSNETGTNPQINPPTDPPTDENGGNSKDKDKDNN